MESTGAAAGGALFRPQAEQLVRGLGPAHCGRKHGDLTASFPTLSPGRHNTVTDARQQLLPTTLPHLPMRQDFTFSVHEFIFTAVSLSAMC